MKKILIGTLLTAAFVVAGTVDVNAQTKSETKVIKREAVKKEAINQKVVKKQKLNTTTTKKVAIQKETPKNKVVTKKMAKQQVKRQPAKLNKKKED